MLVIFAVNHLAIEINSNGLIVKKDIISKNDLKQILNESKTKPKIK